MKRKDIPTIILAALIALPFLALLSMRVTGTDCIKIYVPSRTMIYSESASATNIVAEVNPNDVLYFCGDKNDR